MHSAYLIRHGNSIYRNDELSEIGIRQVQGLYRVLDQRLPENITCRVVISGSGRTTQTAKGLLPLFEKKSGKKVILEVEPLLSQLRSMGSDDQIIANGKENTVLIKKYSGKGDYAFIVGHDKLLVCTANALADENSIEMPQHLRIREYEESYVLQAMNQLDISREEAIEKVKKWGMGPVVKIPPMAEASALFFDFGNSRFEHILPLYE
jgi:hypothetical protein